MTIFASPEAAFGYDFRNLITDDIDHIHSRYWRQTDSRVRSKKLTRCFAASREQWFRDDVAQLESDGASLWDGKALLKTRYATDAEKDFFLEAAEEASGDEMILVYLVQLDVSTLRNR